MVPLQLPVASVLRVSFSRFYHVFAWRLLGRGEEAAASVRPLPVDLNLSGPNRPSSVVANEEPEASSISLLELAASSVPSALDVLPPATLLTAEQEVFRRQTLDEARLAFEVSAASGAVRT